MAQTKDSYANLSARIGLGSGSIQDASSYQFSPISRNRVQLEFAYRSSWTCGMAIDLVAEDMTRAGINILSDDDPNDIKKLNNALIQMKIWDRLNQTIKWSRLYGGAIAVMMIDGQSLETPLTNLDTIRRGQFKGILVLDRWLIQPSLDDLVTEFGADIGYPRFYTVIADAQALVNMKIHYSRVIRMEGIDIPYWQKVAENGWGISVLERIWDRIVAFDSATEGMAQLVYKAHLRTIKIKGLRDIIATGGKAIEGLAKSMESIRQYQTTEGLTILDKDDDFEVQTYSFTGLPETILQLGQQLSGGTQIPLVRFFGQSPAGLNSTGESDLITYYDGVNTKQESMMRNGLMLILQLTYRSVFGRAPSDEFDFEFSSLWQQDDVEKADIAGKITDAVIKAEESGIIGRKTALKELKQSSHITGIYSNISDEEIDAEDNEPPEPEMIGS
jgi:phage-related protein (TIGR01555 family)